MKTEKKVSRPRAKGDQKQPNIVTPAKESIPKEIEKSIGILPTILGRLPIFLPLQQAVEFPQKTKIDLNGDDISFLGENKKIKAVYVDGYLLTTQEEDLLIFVLKKAVKQGSRFVKTSYAEIAKEVLGEKKLNRRIRNKIDELITHLAKAEVYIVSNNDIETTFGFIADRQRKIDEDYRHPLALILKDIIFVAAFRGSFYFQSLRHRRKLRSANLKKVYSFLCATNFKQVSFRKVYVNCRIKQEWKRFKHRTITNPNLIKFLQEAKGREVIIDKERELVIFGKPLPKPKKRG